MLSAVDQQQFVNRANYSEIKFQIIKVKVPKISLLDKIDKYQMVKGDKEGFLSSRVIINLFK